jgi:hypothetical protein
VPDALRRAGATVEVHADHFAPDAPDETWLAVVGERRWVVLTKDQAIRHRETELTALKAANVAAFVLTATGLTGSANGAVLAKALPRMRRVLVGTRRPFVATISASSRITLYSGRRLRGRAPRKKWPPARQPGQV